MRVPLQWAEPNACPFTFLSFLTIAGAHGLLQLCAHLTVALKTQALVREADLLWLESDLGWECRAVVMHSYPTGTPGSPQVALGGRRRNLRSYEQFGLGTLSESINKLHCETDAKSASNRCDNRAPPPAVCCDSHPSGCLLLAVLIRRDHPAEGHSHKAALSQNQALRQQCENWA